MDTRLRNSIYQNMYAVDNDILNDLNKGNGNGGNTDLSDYEKTVDVNKKLNKKADVDKVHTKEEADAKFAHRNTTYTKVETDTTFATKNDLYAWAQAHFPAGSPNSENISKLDSLTQKGRYSLGFNERGEPYEDDYAYLEVSEHIQSGGIRQEFSYIGNNHTPEIGSFYYCYRVKHKSKGWSAWAYIVDDYESLKHVYRKEEVNDKFALKSELASKLLLVELGRCTSEKDAFEKAIAHGDGLFLCSYEETVTDSRNGDEVTGITELYFRMIYIGEHEGKMWDVRAARLGARATTDILVGPMLEMNIASIGFLDQLVDLPDIEDLERVNRRKVDKGTVYTIDESDEKFALKGDIVKPINAYTKTESDDRYFTKTQTTTKINEAVEPATEFISKITPKFFDVSLGTGLSTVIADLYEPVPNKGFRAGDLVAFEFAIKFKSLMRVLGGNTVVANVPKEFAPTIVSSGSALVVKYSKDTSGTIIGRKDYFYPAVIRTDGRVMIGAATFREDMFPDDEIFITATYSLIFNADGSRPQLPIDMGEIGVIDGGSSNFDPTKYHDKDFIDSEFSKFLPRLEFADSLKKYYDRDWVDSEMHKFQIALENAKITIQDLTNRIVELEQKP